MSPTLSPTLRPALSPDSVPDASAVGRCGVRQRHPSRRRRLCGVTFDVRAVLPHAPGHCPSAPICVSTTSGPQRGIPFEMAAAGDSASPAFRTRPGGPQCHNRRPENSPPRKIHQNLTLARPAPVMPRPARRAFPRRRRAPIHRRVPDRPGRPDPRRAIHRPAIPPAVKAATHLLRLDPLPAITRRVSRPAARLPGTRVATSRDHPPVHPNRAVTPSRDRHLATNHHRVRSPATRHHRVRSPATRHRATTHLPPAMARPAARRPGTARPDRRRDTRLRRVPTHRPVRRAAGLHRRLTCRTCPSPAGG